MTTSRWIAILLGVSTVVVGLQLALASWADKGNQAEANHAWLHGPPYRVGYDIYGLPDFGWVNLYVVPSATSKYWDSLTAMDNWRTLHEGDIWWLRFTDYAPEAQAEIIDEHQFSVWSGTPVGDLHTYYCNLYFTSRPVLRS